MAQEIDYRAVVIPDEKSPEEYTYAERRAEILNFVERVGYPQALNQSELARRYDTSPQNVHNDLNVLREFIVEEIDTTRTDSFSKMVFENSIRELVDRGDHKDAVNALSKYNSWLFDRGYQDKSPEKKEINQQTSVEGVGDITMEIAGVSDMDDLPDDPSSDNRPNSVE
jgi:hypothetical protein